MSERFRSASGAKVRYWRNLVLGVLAALCVGAGHFPGGAAAFAAEDGNAPPQIGRLPDYWAESRFLVGAPGVSASVGAGLFNPAAWAVRPDGGFFFGFQDPAKGFGTGPSEVPAGSFMSGVPRGGSRKGDWIGVLSARSLAFGMRSSALDPALGRGGRWKDYTIGLAGGDRSGASGIAYAWSRDGRGNALRADRIVAGMIRRWRPASFGLSSEIERGHGDYFVQADLGLRPFGPRVTLFGEAVAEKKQVFDRIRSGYGVEIQPFRGIVVGAKGQSTGEFGISLQIGLAPGFHPGARTLYDDGGGRTASLYTVEAGLPAPDLGLGPRGKAYPELTLKGPIAYQRYRWFDKRRTLLSTLGQVDAWAADPKVGGVVVDLSGVEASPEILLELRDQLAGLRRHGKKVIIYFDRAGMALYGLATVADQIWMDPQGDLEIPGLVFGRTYLRGALDKIGVGIDELRFFTYKSAVESLSRTSMSDADREQLGAMADDFYDTMASMVTTSRGLSREQWDRVVNEKANLLPKEALEAGLVDSVGTFDQAKKAARKAAVRSTGDPSAAPVTAVAGDPVWSPAEWGRPPRIAVLYGIGVCDMNTGIRGPVLARKIKDAAGDRSVKAIVLRADSPGGDPLPSDLVAREMKEASKKKPVIVSQGQVAGSGGYWISMYGDSIVASPITVTGSIGVISAQLYNNGLGRKLGISYDKVQHGAHADVGRGMLLPLIGVEVPDRDYTPEERARVEKLIRDLYADFVSKVSEGRGLSEQAVDAVGQGRVWSGTRGKEKGLVDEIGGLWRTLEIARAAAGIPEGREIEITEGPDLGSFFLPMPSFRLLGTRSETTAGTLPVPSVLALEKAAGTTLPLSPSERTALELFLRSPGAPLLLTEPLRGPEGLTP